MFSARAARMAARRRGLNAGSGRPDLGRHRDLARQLAEQLGAHLILAPLAVHDVLELGMTSHDSNCNEVDAGGVIGWARGKINIR